VAMENNKNTILALVICFLILIGGLWVKSRIWPDKNPAEPSKDAEQTKTSPETVPTEAQVASEVIGYASVDQWTMVARGAALLAPPAQDESVKTPPVQVKKPDDRKPPAQAVKRTYLQMGDESSTAIYLLDNRGASVRKLVLNRFQAANRIGKPEWLDRDKKVKKPLELLPADKKRIDVALEEEPALNFSNVLYHFPLNSTAVDDRPLDTLGKRNWEVVEPKDPKPDESYSRVVFETEVEGVRVTKTYTLEPDTYHLGLEVSLERTERAPPGKLQFRYQLTSGHSMPIEGEWYTSTFMNALVGRWDKKKETLYRDFQDLRFVSIRGGGNLVLSEEERIIRYAGMATQFFASVIVVDDKQRDLDFLKSARPTLETAAVKGTLKSKDPSAGTFVLKPEKEAADMTFQVPPNGWERFQFKDPPDGKEVGVLYITDSHDRNVAIDVRDPDQTNPMFLDDVTVRVNTVPIELEPGNPVTHKYLLYNGPVKVRLLSHLDGEAAVNEGLVSHYLDDLHLDTLTDYHFQGTGFPAWFGENISNRIYLTRLLISTTNMMHAVLTFLHRWIPGGSWGLCIIVLTVMVRGCMFPLSRKQALMSLRMQELQPEIKKLQEKFKDDRQALGLAQMELFRKHKVSPLGTCWVAFLQMPIFLGLYYCLQESIHFRLAPFLWIQNLAAPDMLFWWSESIPFISASTWYGALWYLGPYFNLLPVIAVALMITQQSMMTPPATDETQAMQQKMMKYMMIFFGVMFYKVAAGLCIYFIASSVWGFTERKLLPKRKREAATPAATHKPGFLQRAMNRLRGADTTSVTRDGALTNGTASAEPALGSRAKRKARNQRRGQTAAAKDSTWQRLKDWWADVLKQASKK
jgi:YidC/Oxa1 family membrane protein insertase